MTANNPIITATQPQGGQPLPDPRQPLAESWTQPLHLLFQQQATRNAAKVALQDAASQWTYAELESRSNQLAQALRQAGIQNEDLVAIHAVRSASLVWAVLGVLKAGAAFMLLDAAYPAPRLRSYLEAAAPRAWLGLAAAPLPAELADWLAQADLACQFSLPRSATAVPTRIAQQPTTAPNVSVGPEDLAYVLFTSGSTGTPKGIMGSHSPLSHFFPWQIEAFGLSADDRFSMLSGMAHDPLLRDIFTPLLAGATLHIPAQEMLLQPGQLALWLAENEITVAHLTPPMAQVIALTPASQPDPYLPSLRYAFFGGDRLTSQAVQATRSMAPHVTCVNFYGATETPQAMAYHILSAEDGLVANQPIPLGRGIDSVQIIVAQADGRLTEPNEVGEIFIRTPYLSKGYLNAPDLTDERYIPNPHTNDAADLWYRTGDLGRYLPDGQVVFAGRADRQIKIRGFRIEPGDIEAALQRLDGVHQSLVMPWTDDAGTVRLAAYVVSAAPLASQTLRTELAASLPDYMVPASFIALEAMPLTPNGKIDHSALPQPDVQHEVAAHYVAPRNETEAALAAVWAEAFGLEQVGIEDNYFDLGGDSIRSIRLLGKARDVGLDIQLTDLFRYQTIAALAPHVTVGQISSDGIAPFSLIPDTVRAMLPADAVDAYPLSNSQAGMLYHSELEPDSTVFFNVNAKVLRAPFDQAKFEAAMATLAQRHPILRTSFHLNGYPQQIQMVHETAVIPLQIDDLRHLSPSEQATILENWIAAEQIRPYDWESGAPIRFHVHRLDDDTFQLTMSEHHVLLDGWSEAMIQAELFQLYLANLGEPITVPPAPLAKYSDYVATVQDTITDEAHRSYWSAQVADVPPNQIPRWPKEHTPGSAKNPADQDITQRRHSIVLSPEVVEELQTLARETGVHMKHVFLAAHFYVLSLLSGQKDVVTGLVTNGRLEQTDGERTLGLFLNLVPLQQQVAEGSWTDLIRNVFTAEQEMLPHRRFPLIEIRQLRPGQPLFESVFNFNHFHIYDALYQMENFQILEDRYYASTSDTFSFGVLMDPVTAVVKLTIEYATALFPQAQIEAIADYYGQTLADMARQPNASYTNYSPMSAAERTLLLNTWNDTAADYPAESCIQQLIAEQADRTPQATAVVSNTETLTYQELVSRANQLAHHLRNLGVGPETIVGISVGRVPDLIVGLLGILNAGGAYLPLDPEYPQDRLAFMIEDAQTPVIVTTDELAQKLPTNQVKIVKIDADWPTIAQQPTTVPDSGVTPDNLAYIIYTSGSTGKPKGVMIPHRALTNENWGISRNWYNVENGLHATDRILQLATINFDSAVEEIFPTLISGATLVLSPTNKLIATDMNALIDQHQITLLEFSTAYWHLWVRELEQSGLSIPTSLRAVSAGGEAMNPSVVAAWYRLTQNGRVALINGYGPTETTITATGYTLRPEDSAATAIPIGQPLDNFTAYVLNAKHQPVPIGVPGELYIGGASVARGYLRRPERTAQAFLPDPFAADPQARMYKTGDLVRWLPDGNIEYLGRTDFQVKVRGYRIELGEIETALLQVPGVHECLVTVHEAENSDKRIVAYILAAPDANADDLKQQALETHLLKHLPEYMVPSAFMCLDAWPLTPNGKINRHALPTNFEMGSEREIVAPRTVVEANLITIWQELLGVAQVSVHDNFFKLGGHSLKAMQLVSRLRDAFNVALPLRLIFEASTVADMATAVESLQHIALTPQANEFPDDDFEEGEI